MFDNKDQATIGQLKQFEVCDPIHQNNELKLVFHQYELHEQLTWLP